MADDISDLRSDIKSLHQTILGLTGAFHGLANSAGKNSKVMRDQDDLYKKAITSTLQLQRTSITTKSNYDKLAEARTKDVRALKDHIAAQKETSKEMILAERAVMKQVDAIQYYNKEILRSKRFTDTAVSSFSRLGGSIGLSTVSFRDGVKQLLSYNQALFQVSRMQGLSGRDMSNIASVMREVKKETTLSASEFGGLAATVNQVYLGIRPTTREIKELAVSMEKQFGPGIDIVNKNMNTFLQIQNKMPSLAANIKRAFKTQDEALKGINVAAAIGAGFDRSSVEWILQYQTKVTKGQEKQQGVNRDMAAANRDVKDASMSMAKAAEGGLKVAAKSASVLLTTMEKMPIAILASAAAFRVMGSQAIQSLAQMRVAGTSMATMSTMSAFGGRGGMAGMGMAGMGMAGMAASPLMAGPTGPGGRYIIGAKDVAGSALVKVPKPKLSASVGAGMRGYAPMAAIGAGMSGWSEYQESRQMGLGKGRSAVAATAKGGFNFAGAMAGAAAGAAIGTAVPVIGNAVGAVVGGIIGGLGGDLVGDLVAGWIQTPAEEAQKELEKAQVAAAEVTLEYHAAAQNLKMQSEFQERIVASLDKQISVAAGLNNLYTSTGKRLGEAARERIKEIEKSISLAEDFARVQIGTMAKLATGGRDVAWFKYDEEKSEMQNLQDFMKEAINLRDTYLKMAGEATTQAKLRGIEGNEAAERSALERAQEYQNTALNLAPIISQNEVHIKTLTTAQERLGKAAREAWNAEADALQRNQSLIQDRISAQRKLMQTTMFGLGADIGMLQKQVGMSQKMIAIENKRMSDARKLARERTNVTDSELDILGAMEDANMQQEYAKQLTGGNVKLMNDLIGYANDYQKAMTKAANETERIYQLTKEMREGYLDAIREMAYGAGEFSKIIGTQEVGITQLMDSVASMNAGVQKLNTMGRGGQGQFQYLDPSRTSIAGRYTAQFGGQFLKPEQSMGRLADIFMGPQSVMQAMSPTGYVGGAVSPEAGRAVAAARSNMFGAGVLGSAGAAVQAGAQNELQEALSSQATKSNLREAVKEGVLDAKGLEDRGMAAPSDVEKPSPRTGTVGDTRAIQTGINYLNQSGFGLQGSTGGFSKMAPADRAAAQEVLNLGGGEMSSYLVGNVAKKYKTNPNVLRQNAAILAATQGKTFGSKGFVGRGKSGGTPAATAAKELIARTANRGDPLKWTSKIQLLASKYNTTPEEVAQEAQSMLSYGGGTADTKKGLEGAVKSQVATMSIQARQMGAAKDVLGLGKAVFDPTAVAGVVDKWDLKEAFAGQMTNVPGIQEAVEGYSRQKFITGPQAIQYRSSGAAAALQGVPGMMGLAAVGGNRGLSSDTLYSSIAASIVAGQQADMDYQTSINERVAKNAAAAEQRNLQAGIGYYDPKTGNLMTSPLTGYSDQDAFEMGSKASFRGSAGKMVESGALGPEAAKKYAQLQEDWLYSDKSSDMISRQMFGLEGAAFEKWSLAKGPDKIPGAPTTAWEKENLKFTANMMATKEMQGRVSGINLEKGGGLFNAMSEDEYSNAIGGALIGKAATGGKQAVVRIELVTSPEVEAKWKETEQVLDGLVQISTMNRNDMSQAMAVT